MSYTAEVTRLRDELEAKKLKWRTGKIPADGFYLLRYDNTKYLRPEWLNKGLLHKSIWPSSMQWAGPIEPTEGE
jgi:hypothetical protein